jgi:hypothetical protein
MVLFFNGVTTAASLAVGLLFLRLWRETRDRFFALFGLAFWVLALNSVVLLAAVPASEHQHYFYIGRLVAFLLIAAAVVDKNRSSNSPPP